MLEFFDGVLRALGQRLDTSVLEIANVTADLVAGGRSLCKIPKADTLNLAADHEFSRDRHG
jgi:hypothetical protein